MRISTSRLRIVAVEGPENTFIVGASDHDSTEEGRFAGCGANAVRGVFMTGKNDVSIQGFTITGCYSRESSWTYATPKRGAAFYCEGFDGGATRAQITDCIVSNNVGVTSVIHGGLVKRCIIADNVSGGMIMTAQNDTATDHKNASAVACVFANNDSVRGDIGGGARAFNCTIIGATNSGVSTSDSAAYSLNTIYYGGETVNGASTMSNCVVWGCADTSSLSGTPNKVENPMFASRKNGDYSVDRYSPCVGFAAALDSDPYFWGVFDGAMDGPLIFKDGCAVVGAYQKTVRVIIPGLCVFVR